MADKSISYVSRWAEARKVLCVRLDGMGDLLMTTPALWAVSANGARHVTLLTCPARELARAQDRQAHEPTEKQKGLTRKETDQWLAEFGIDPDQEEDPYEPMRRG